MIPRIQEQSVPFLSVAQTVEVDRAMIEDYGILLVQMMENAGRNLAHLARLRFLSNEPTAERDLSDSGQIKAFADQSQHIHAQLEKNLAALDADEFSGILRPVFQKDEWKLVLAGGVIGTGIGALQVVLLFGGFG